MMANNILSYKGYQAVIEYSADDASLFGRVLDIDDLIIFEISDPMSSETVFRETIDEYLDFCEEQGKEPCRPYAGTFSVHIPAHLHKQATISARRYKISLNELVQRAIQHEIDGGKSSSVIKIYLNQRRSYPVSDSTIDSYSSYTPANGTFYKKQKERVH